jgi:hypothetical protein
MRCPVCRATVDLSLQCRRCRADLSLLCRIEDERRSCLALAGQQLAFDGPGPALDAAKRADELRPGIDSKRLLALTHLLRRDFSLAWRYYLEERTRFREGSPNPQGEIPRGRDNLDR